jgi:hypothetical protein
MRAATFTQRQAWIETSPKLMWPRQAAVATVNSAGSLSLEAAFLLASGEQRLFLVAFLRV